jgi:hypothetical protein
MKGIEDDFDETFKELWPDFNLEARAIKVPTEVLEREFKSFKIKEVIVA